MEICYKELDDDDLPSIRIKQVQKEPDDENAPQENNDILTYLDPEQFLEFITSFHEAVLSRSSTTIIDSLHRFFSNITYTDKDSNECKIILLDYSPFHEQIPIIADDIIFCLSDQTFDDNHRSVFELIEYISGQSLFFIECFLEKDGIDYIISYANNEDEEIVLKSIQLISEFSGDTIYQKIICDEFILMLFKICDSLFNGSFFTNTFDNMSYYCSFLLKQIIRSIVNQPDQNEQQNMERITNLGFYDVIWYFFFKNENIPHSQSEAIETFKLLCTNEHFINIKFPQILDFLAQMIKENKLLPQNRIKIYQLICDVYNKNSENEVLISCIDPIQQDGKKGIPWELLLESISSENKNEIFAAFEVLQTLFNYNSYSIRIAIDMKLNIALIDIVQNAQYDIKTKALQVVYTWISCHHTDADNESFISFDFLEYLFPILESDDKDLNIKSDEKELNLNFQAYRVILQIFSLNTRFPYLDQESLDLYDKRLKEVLRNSDI